MDKSVAFYLVAKTVEQDDFGQFIEETTNRLCYGQIGSVSMTEFYSAGQNGFKPEYRITMFGPDYEGEDELIPADTTIIAINQRPKDKLVNTTHGLEANERGLLIVDENKMTTRPGVFAAGDVTHGSLTVVHAVDEARIAAAGMMKYMEENG